MAHLGIEAAKQAFEGKLLDIPEVNGVATKLDDETGNWHLLIMCKTIPFGLRGKVKKIVRNVNFRLDHVGVIRAADEDKKE